MSYPSTVIRRIQRFNLAAPGADTNIFTAIVPRDNSGIWRISIALTVSSTLNLSVTDGTTTHILALNGNVPLTAASMFNFSIGVTRQDQSNNNLSYSLQIGTDGVVEFLIIDELTSGVS